MGTLERRERYELTQKYPEWAAVPYGIRGTATNHVVGNGWWSWWIPLKGGDVSVGVVFDQRLDDARYAYCEDPPAFDGSPNGYRDRRYAGKDDAFLPHLH